jgi:histidine triad (HIT) family protein
MDDAAHPCTFCRIARGELAADMVLEDDAAVAFLDKRPLFKGHCLLVPRAHWATLTDLPHDLVGPLFSRAKELAQAVETALRADGIFLAMNNRVSQSVPHLHIHIVPRRNKDGLRGFFWPREKYESPEESRLIAAAIRKALAAL